MRAPTASVIGAALLIAAGAGQASGTSEAQSGYELPCTPPYGTFRAGNWPPGCWRPYSDESPWNRPIGRRPHLDPSSRKIALRVRRWGGPDHVVAGQADTPDDYNHPTFYSTHADPRFRLHCYQRIPRRRCALEGKVIRVPDAARPAAGGDAHMTIVDQYNGWEYDLWKVRRKARGGGRLEFRWGGRTLIEDDGLGSDATAARFGNLAGIIRAQELEAGRIDHALFLVARCDSGSYVYPAMKSGRPCSELGRSNRHAPPMGTRFQLNMSQSEIDSLRVPAWRKTIFRAMAKYGMYFGDTGDGTWGVQPESGTTYTSFGREDRLVTYARRAGVPTYRGRYVFNVRDGVNWWRRLRVVHECEALGSC